MHLSGYPLSQIRLYSAMVGCMLLQLLRGRLLEAKNSCACSDEATGVHSVVGRFVYTSVVPWVETIRIPRAEGCRPLGGANVCNSWYHFNTSVNLEISRRQNSIQFTLHTGTKRIQDVNLTFSPMSPR